MEIEVDIWWKEAADESQEKITQSEELHMKKQIQGAHQKTRIS